MEPDSKTHRSYMKILTSGQHRQADTHTIENGVPSLDLMETAARAFSHFFLNRELHETVHVFCGTGNNGGDGMAIARLLDLLVIDVKAYMVHYSNNYSGDMIANYKRLDDTDVEVNQIYSKDDFPEIEEGDTIVDALFGTGLNRPAEGMVKELIEYLNGTGNNIYSVDIPSGLFADRYTPEEYAVIRSEYTLTFTSPKLAFLLPFSQRYIGQFAVMDIGIDKEYIESLDTPYYYMLNQDVEKLYRKRRRFDHKGNFGHALIIAGSSGKTGAAVLATRGALVAGAGLVTAYVPKSSYGILQTAVPEAMTEVDADEKIMYFNYEVQPDVIGIGPGLGTAGETVEGFADFLKRNEKPLVIDADALNILALEPSLLGHLPEGCILTPHEGEFKRLAGPWKDDFDKLEKLMDFSRRHRCVMVLKGAYTVIAYEGNYYFNSTGNPAMATAGMGDVLTGIITGLRAQSYSPLHAAILGVYLHGLAGNQLYWKMKRKTLLAGDIISMYPEAVHTMLTFDTTPEVMSYLEMPFTDDIDYFDEEFFDDMFDPLDEDDDLPE